MAKRDKEAISSSSNGSISSPVRQKAKTSVVSNVETNDDENEGKANDTATAVKKTIRYYVEILRNHTRG